VDNDKWTLPGGTHEFGESIGECAIREFVEETGLEVELTGIVGTYTSPEVLIEYSDGEIRQEFTIVFAGKKLSGNIKIDSESKEYEWVSLDDIENMNLADSQKRRLKDVKSYLKNGVTQIK
jgi:8-oxo-dGTP pyrophosphatase MutT (NUDIX family)